MLNLSKSKQHEINNLNTPITLHEMETVIKILSRKKNPGLGQGHIDSAQMSINHQGRITSSTSQTILQNRNGRVIFKFEATINLILTLQKDSRKKKIIEQYPL